uniref:hypothetical protein n=1 Tax=Segatella copri TaxID=165179 RepID=UPI00294B29B2|nr:hypothetical protein [Segatella copri]
MNFPEIYSATGMMELILKIGFLPLLDSGIEGFSAEDIVAEDADMQLSLKAVGTGRWSILPKSSMAGRLANATELPKSLIRGISSI